MNGAGVGVCGAEVYHRGKPTGELCKKPVGHKSAHSPWWPGRAPSQMRRGRLAEERTPALIWTCPWCQTKNTSTVQCAGCGANSGVPPRGELQPLEAAPK